MLGGVRDRWGDQRLGLGPAVASHGAMVCVGSVSLNTRGCLRPPLAFQPFTRSEIIGFTIGSISSVLYLCSRVPQIYTNVSAAR